MSVDKDTVNKIARLSRIAISDAEADKMVGELNGILAWVEQLGEVDVTGVEPMTAVIPNKLRLRDDVVTDGDASGRLDGRAEVHGHAVADGQQATGCGAELDRAVVGYLLVCPQPEASGALRSLRQTEPRRVADAVGGCHGTGDRSIARTTSRLLLFVTANMTRQPLMVIVREAAPFIATAIVVLAIITLVPEAVLWLPRAMGL